MTAQYKLRTQLSDKNKALAHITVRVEKHFFIDSDHFDTFSKVAEPIAGVRGLYGSAKSILGLLGNDAPKTTLLGMETDWRDIGETDVEQLISDYYDAVPSFNVALQGDANNGAIIIAAGRASMAVPLTRDIAASEKQKLDNLVQYCKDHPPKNESDVKKASDAVIGVGGTATAIYGAGTACLEGATEGGLIGGALGSAIGCVAGIAAALGAFIGLVDSARAKQEKESDMRDREKVCGPTAGEPSRESVDRASRTC